MLAVWEAGSAARMSVWTQDRHHAGRVPRQGFATGRKVHPQGMGSMRVVVAGNKMYVFGAFAEDYSAFRVSGRSVLRFREDHWCRSSSGGVAAGGGGAGAGTDAGVSDTPPTGGGISPGGPPPGVGFPGRPPGGPTRPPGGPIRPPSGAGFPGTGPGDGDGGIGIGQPQPPGGIPGQPPGGVGGGMPGRPPGGPLRPPAAVNQVGPRAAPPPERVAMAPLLAAAASANRPIRTPRRSV